MTDEYIPTPTVSKGGLIAKSILMIVLGILMTVFTFTSIVASTIIISVLLIFCGVVLICSGGTFLGLIKRTWWLIVLGIIAVIFGVVSIINPIFGAEVIMYIIAASALIGGVTDLIMGVTGAVNGISRVFAVITGILGVALGVMFIVLPVLSAFTLVWIAGIFLIAFGVIALIQAFVA